MEKTKKTELHIENNWYELVLAFKLDFIKYIVHGKLGFQNINQKTFDRFFLLDWKKHLNGFNFKLNWILFVIEKILIIYMIFLHIFYTQWLNAHIKCGFI